jgi:hypothetical protein
MRRTAPLLIWLLAAGCSIGAPPGFPTQSESWTAPLVGPLENGVLVTPVMIGGHGPYLFAIDPDALVSAVDTQVVRDAHLWIGQGPRRVDETWTSRPRFYAELVDIRIGNLTIERRGAMVFAVGAYDTEARHISGILGHDVFAESLVFGFDRDQGLITLSTVQAFHPPADAVAVTYEQTGNGTSKAPAEPPLWQNGLRAGVGWTPRRLATAEIGGRQFAMHLDLGAANSQLDESKWAAAGLAPAAIHFHLTDEAGTPRNVERAGIASRVVIGPAITSDVTFVPYIDERFPFQGVDGALGLDFFRRFNVFASWDNHTYYLRPRGDLAATTAARLARWGAAIPVCPHAGCVTAEVIAADNGPILHVVRDPQAGHIALEIGLAPEGDHGATAVPLVVSLPAIADQLTRPISPIYLGTTLNVVDISPFPRRCPTPGGCVRQLGRIQAPELARVPAGLVGMASPEP